MGDYIIVADQGSTDGLRDIAASFPKVILIDNPSKEFNEPEGQKILLEEARRIPGRRLIIALDADEFITANFLTSPEWDAIQNIPVGTLVKFQWAVVLPDLLSYWLWPWELPLGNMDDFSQHKGNPIHSPRIPLPNEALTISLREIKLMHYNRTDPERTLSIVRWYQC